MDYLIYFLAVIGLLVLLYLLFLYLRTYFNIKEITDGKPKVFDNPLDLMKFIRLNYACEIQQNVPLYGFVVDVAYNDAIAKMGLGEPVLDISVAIITQSGHEEIFTQCGDINANLKKGDFVAVNPIFYEKENIWNFITVYKLKSIFLGDAKGFLVDEDYLN
ncbi:hypothetical protein [Acinetobacter sp. WCHAc060025]|uniref:hypothetical protein n=1 Tax=Acinetobacter sp. WCHAc060025 TaxID=2518625 RepID=UPI0010237956|nr:hypothetical protein [Acinetobacter sp. WCHAc060025]RZG72439.1 hypothetical protein EXE09_17115 [Acinetobacter sp. WCHAc060025]